MLFITADFPTENKPRTKMKLNLYNPQIMKTHIIIFIITILYSLSCFYQTDIPFKLGKTCYVYGQITDKIAKDSLTLVTLEFMDKNFKKIKATRSDFDGMYLISFCSNKLANDTFIIKTTK